MSLCRGVTMVLVALAFGALEGCGNSANTKPAASNSSVSDLLTKLPNLKPLGIDSCTYTLDKSSANSRLPSPSDVKMTLRGSAQLSAEGFKTLTSRFVWKPISRKDVPKILLPIVPAGNLLSSHKFNESFADNPTYAHGFVVLLAGGKSRSIFLLSTDMDHPIK